MFSIDGYISAPDLFAYIRYKIAGQETDKLQDAEELQIESDLAFMGFLLKYQKGLVVSPQGVSFEVGHRFLTETFGSTRYPACFDLNTGLVGRVTREESGWGALRQFAFKFLFGFSAFFVAAMAVLTFPYLLREFLPLDGGQTLSRAEFALLAFLGALLGGLWFACLTSIPVMQVFAWYRSKKNDFLTDWSGFSVVFDRKLAEEYLSSEVAVTVQQNDKIAATAEKSVTREIIAAQRLGRLTSKSDMMAEMQSRGMKVRSFMRAWEKARETVPEIGNPGRKPKQ